MKLKSSIALIAMGVGGTLMYQNIMNGNAKRFLKNIARKDIEMMDDLEDMMD